MSSYEKYGRKFTYAAKKTVAFTAPIFTKIQNNPQNFCGHLYSFFPTNPIKNVENRAKFCLLSHESKQNFANFHETRRRSTAFSADFQNRIS
jgi:hypothetical protein